MKSKEQKTKIFAAYLPQYHETEENNLFWGEGYTDWVGVKNAKPISEGHRQPKVPLNEKYYDLSDVKNIAWQAELAKKYGIDGFCIYHYWFEGGKAVLDTPARLIKEHPEIDINYFFSWDNSSWIRSWSNISGNAWAPDFDGVRTSQNYLLKHDYGDQDSWDEHFYWLLPFFRDERYYKIEDRPVFVFFNVDKKEVIEKVAARWKYLAEKNGIKGLYLITGVGPFRNQHCLDAQFKYQPLGLWNKKKALARRIGKLIKKDGFTNFPNRFTYTKAWKKILRQSKRYIKQSVYVSGIVRYDDTPRRGEKSNIIYGDTPELFEKYFGKLYEMCCAAKMEFMFLTAWNEWGEGAYLEPDEDTEYKYLEAVGRVLGQEEKR